MYYKIFMLIALPLLAIGWIAYAIWMHKVREEEKKAGRTISGRLKKTKSEVADWAEKMVKFQPPTRKKTEDREQKTEDRGQKTEDRRQTRDEGRETRDE